jgi:hypothetical protein
MNFKFTKFCLGILVERNNFEQRNTGQVDCRYMHFACDDVEWNAIVPDKLQVKLLYFPKIMMWFCISFLTWAAGTVQDSRNVLKSSLTHQLLVCGDDEVNLCDVNINTTRNEVLVHVRTEVDERKP